jgi:antitoxin HicB
MLQYQALFEPTGEGGYVVTFPDFRWGVTQGDSLEQVGEMATDALSMILNDLIEKGERLPTPGKHRGRKFRAVRLPALHGTRVELYVAFHASGVREAELARRMGISKVNVDRLFDLNHQSQLDQIEAAFRALGKELTFGVETQRDQGPRACVAKQKSSRTYLRFRPGA